MNKEAPGRGSKLDGIKEKAGKFKEQLKALGTPEGRKTYVEKNKADLKTLLNTAKEISLEGGEESKKAVMEALRDLLAVIGEILHADLIREDFDIGLTNIIDEALDRPRVLSKEEFLKVMEEDPASLSETLGLTPLREKQKLKVAQAEHFIAFAERFVKENRVGGKTWSMALSRRLSPAAAEARAQNLEAQLAELKNSGIQKLMQDPDANLRDIAPEMVAFFENPGEGYTNALAYALRPVQFEEINTPGDLNLFETSLMEALRALGSTDLAEEFALDNLRPHIDKARETLLTKAERDAIVLEHYKKIILTNSTYQHYFNQGKSFGANNEDAKRFVYGIAELDAQREIDQTAAGRIDHKSLPIEQAQLLAQYTDMTGGGYLDLNLSDENLQLAKEELLINGAFIVATMGTASVVGVAARGAARMGAARLGTAALAAEVGVEGAATSIKLSSVTLQLMERSPTLARYVPALRKAHAVAAKPASKLLVASTVDKAYSENVALFRDTEEFNEVMMMAPNWVPGIISNLVVGKAVEKFMGIKIPDSISRNALDRVSSRITNLAVKQIARELILKQPAEISLKYLIGAMQNGAIDMTHQEFNDEFGDAAYALYLQGTNA
jgi:hypothetical protein